MQDTSILRADDYIATCVSEFKDDNGVPISMYMDEHKYSDNTLPRIVFVKGKSHCLYHCWCAKAMRIGALCVHMVIICRSRNDVVLKAGDFDDRWSLHQPAVEFAVDNISDNIDGTFCHFPYFCFVFAFVFFPQLKHHMTGIGLVDRTGQMHDTPMEEFKEKHCPNEHTEKGEIGEIGQSSEEEKAVLVSGQLTATLRSITRVCHDVLIHSLSLLELKINFNK